MSGEGSRSTRFASRSARWAHNHRVTWLADGGASEDLAVVKQPSPPPYGTSSLPYGNGNGHDGNGYNGNGHNGNGHNGNGHNGNGHSYAGNGNGNGNGHAKKLHGSRSDGERERLKAEVVYWGLQQSQQGRMLSEDQLQQEFDRRLHSAELLLGDLELDLQQEYDRLRAAEQLLREREERQHQVRFPQPDTRFPQPDTRFHQPDTRFAPPDT